MKTCHVTKEEYWTDNGCDCCPAEKNVVYNCEDIPHSMNNELQVYYDVFEKETSINLYHMEYEYQPTQEVVRKTLLAMNIDVVIEEE